MLVFNFPTKNKDYQCCLRQSKLDMLGIYLIFVLFYFQTRSRVTSMRLTRRPALASSPPTRSKSDLQLSDQRGQLRGRSFRRHLRRRRQRRCRRRCGTFTTPTPTTSRPGRSTKTSTECAATACSSSSRRRPR